MNRGEAGLIIIGDELLCGKRHDRHFNYVMERLIPLGWQLAWVSILPDDEERLVEQFRRSLSEELPVFCFGGIGATPDDLTRQSAAKAAAAPLIRHPDAIAEIEAHFGEAAYPNRVRMGELPQGSRIIPNPVNRIPGFSLHRHHFFPGFPELAWPMFDWVLSNEYGEAPIPLQERVVTIRGMGESQLLGLMEEIRDRYPQVKLFSLPHLLPEPMIELGVRGRVGVDDAFAGLMQVLERDGVTFEI